MKIVNLTLAVLLSPVFSLFAQGNSPQPTLTIQQNHVIAANFTPGATIVFYSVALVGDGYSTLTKSRTARLTDDDRDGSVTFDCPPPMPFRSVWIAANETNGDYAMASPPEYFFKRGNAPVLRKHGSNVDEVAWPGHITYLFYVHPGKGAWTGSATDGSSVSDADGRVDFVTSLALSRLRPVVEANADKPDKLVPGGTLFLVDGYELRTAVMRLDGATLNGVK